MAGHPVGGLGILAPLRVSIDITGKGGYCVAGLRVWLPPWPSLTPLGRRVKMPVTALQSGNLSAPSVFAGMDWG